MWKGTVRMTGTELADEIERHLRQFPPHVRERETSKLLARAATALRRPATVYSHLTQEQFDQLQADAISWRTRQPSSDQVLANILLLWEAHRADQDTQDAYEIESYDAVCDALDAALTAEAEGRKT